MMFTKKLGHFMLKTKGWDSGFIYYLVTLTVFVLMLIYFIYHGKFNLYKWVQL